MEAGRERSEGCQLFCTTFPCVGCAKKIVQMGIVKVVYSKPYAPTDALSSQLLKSTGIAIEQYEMPTEMLPTVQVTMSLDESFSVEPEM